MTITKQTRILVIIFTIIALLSVGLFAVSAYADTRATPSRDRGDTSGRLPETAPPTPTPDPAPTPPTTTGGGISNSTEGSATSGGNQGGNVITGDEHVEVTVVNIGPTNQPPTVVVTPPGGDSPPAQECDPRTRIGCTTQDSGGRTR